VKKFFVWLDLRVVAFLAGFVKLLCSLFQELSTEPPASAIGFPLPSSIFFKPAR
jgi:hypothetical protein